MARERRISGGAPPGAVPPAMPPMAQMAAMAQMGRGMPPTVSYTHLTLPTILRV